MQKISLKEYHAFFFDFDGVLADTVEIKSRAFAELFRPFAPDKIEMIMEHHRRNGGINREEKIRFYYQSFLGQPVNDELIADLCRRFAQLVFDGVVSAPEIPGSEDFLKKCRNLLPMFLISATPEPEIKLITKQRSLEKYFKEVLGAPTGKEAHLKYLLNKYHLNPGKCLYFGDSEKDFQAARSCGINFTAIVSSQPTSWLSCQPDLPRVKDFQEIVCT